MHTGPSLVKVVEVVAFLSSICALMGSSVQKWGTAGGHAPCGHQPEFTQFRSVCSVSENKDSESHFM